MRISHNHGVNIVNQMAEANHSGWRAVSELARAKTLIADHDFDAAARIYQDLLTTGLPTDLLVEAQTNLAAALCAMAQNGLRHAATAVSLLDQARALQIEVLKTCNPKITPRDWTSNRANLALIHLARYRVAGGEQDVLLAHLALDGTETALQQINDTEMLDWVRSIRDYLVELRDRRTAHR